MSLDIAKALQSGAERMTKRNALIALGLLFGFRVVDTVVSDSFAERLFVDVINYEERIADLQAQTNQPIQDPGIGEFAFAFLDLPVSVLSVLALALFVVGIVVRVGIIRTFVSEETQSLPTENFTRRLGWTVLNLIIGAIIYFLAVGIGLVLFIVPGIYIAVALFFYNYEIIIAEKGVIDAFSGSLDLTANNRLPLFLLGLIFAVLGAVVSNVFGAVLPGATVAGTLVRMLVNAALAVFGITVAAQAYNQLRSLHREARIE
ncbi:hypothetical protein [Salinibaculum salinum]|uniref:hypothetical protein n=1 Tax=Salinibaculum salinum TaxID=3131996 RepID=UPI0030EEFFA1